MYKQVIVVRTDIEMSRGKLASQASHASVSALEKAAKTIAAEWKKEGQKKVVLKVADLQELVEIKSKCDKAKIPNALISDAGHTEIEAGTITALGIGPDKESKIDKVTGHLRIL
ncbi:MAG: peptidyl-tRNA hydrolase [Candidatus Aenigmarchaeota archaeon]|nr:peptidyl-tRNA hydrolase [Candidatus Aenigmarchaeota archaeon]